MLDEDITHVGIRGHWNPPGSQEPGENCMAVQVDPNTLETTFRNISI